ncbi:MAG: hypothetical protein KUL82_05845 [Bdellovibrio sp.]|uniref:hypothetical protein n=1 Tax=Bdellovibrio sp. TaxID=28201 RepID=UPI0039E61B81|nr:hypothetical protein [Bdellovibrio sp.]
MFQRLFIPLTLSALFLSGCASGTFKARQEQREKLAASTGMYCEFVSGDLFPDVDVELSMKMASRCDSSKSFSITNYKNSSDQAGVIYCCSMAGKGERRAAVSSSSEKKATPAKGNSAQDPNADVIAE